MANNKKGKSNGKPKNNNGPKKMSKGATMRRGTNPPKDDLLYKHLRMVADPCGSPITETAYAGPEGTVQRFVTTGQLASASDIAAFGIFTPGGFRTALGIRATGATASVLGYGVGDTPGYNFLQGNSKGARPVAACLRLHWNGPELNRAGSLACGVLPAGAFVGGTSPTVNQIYGLLGEKGRMPAGECEIIWNPSEQDAEYDICDAAISVPTFDDKNSLVFAFQGAPGFAIGWTYTVVYEWTPALGLGLVQHTTVHRAVPDAVASINNALARMGFKNKPLRQLAGSVFNTVAQYTPGGGALRLIKQAAGAVHTLIP